MNKNNILKMNREDKQLQIRLQRKKLIEELEIVYINAFNELSNLEIEEGSIVKLSQAFLLSREAAIKELDKEIEKQIITTSSKLRKEN